MLFKKINVILIWFMILTVCLWNFAYSSRAAQADPAEKKIRVGFPIQGGLSQINEIGEYSGYTYDYLQEIAQYTGWEYEFIEVPGDINESLYKMLDMLSNDEIDLLGGMVKNSYTQSLWDFPEYGYGFSYSTLGVLEENTGITENNYQSIKGLRIAVYKNGVTKNEKLKAFCESNNIDYVLVEYEDADEILAALKRGDADAAIGNDLIPTPGIRTIAQFDGSQYYYAVGKGNSKLLNELNRSILTIRQIKPYFEADLYHKYFSYQSSKIYFTEEEQLYLQSSPSLNIEVISNYPPIQYTDSEGNPKGILIDLLRHIETETGIKFRMFPASSFQEAFRMLDEAEVEAICGIPYDYKLAQSHDLIMSNSIFSAQMVLVTGKNEDAPTNQQTIGVLDRMQENHGDPTKTWVSFDNVKDSLDSVLSGQIDSASVNLYSSEYLTRSGRYKQLFLIPQTGNTSDYCIGIRKPMNTELVSIIEKVIHSMPKGDLETIVFQNTTSVHQRVTISDFVQNNPFLSLGFISALFIIFGISGIFVMRFRMKSINKMAIENQRYQKLSELANEFIYEYNFANDTISFSKAFSSLFSVQDKINQFSRIVDGTDTQNHSLNPDMIHLFRQMFQHNAYEEKEFHCRLPGGTERWYRNTFQTVCAEDGKPVYIIGKLTDVQEEKAEKERLEKELLLDGLTGIYNAKASRTIIEERLQNLTQSGALLIMDIDCFKGVNDQLGHYTGDIVLKDFADLLNKTCGKWDVAGRLGGDEFILFIHSCSSLSQLTDLCQSLCGKARRTYSNEEGRTAQITVSVGAAFVNHSCDFTKLYQAVDKRMYESKLHGRDQFTIMTPDEI